MNVVLKTLIVVGASLVVAVPAGAAATRPDDRPGARGPGAIADPALADAVGSGTGAPIRPDDRAGRREVPLGVPILTPSAVTDGFDWGDAGIGAGTVGGIAGLLLAAASIARGGRRGLEQT